eukprot:gene29583-28835_t
MGACVDVAGKQFERCSYDGTHKTGWAPSNFFPSNTHNEIMGTSPFGVMPACSSVFDCPLTGTPYNMGKTGCDSNGATSEC